MLIKKKIEALTPKYIIDDNFIIYSSAPVFNTFIKKTYGFNLFFKKFIYKRFEILKNFNVVNLDFYGKNTLRYFRYFLPKNKDYRYRYYAHLYFLFHNKLYRGYRHIMGLPTRGQRT
jgi:ribosomal protein S13